MIGYKLYMMSFCFFRRDFLISKFTPTSHLWPRPLPWVGAGSGTVNVVSYSDERFSREDTPAQTCQWHCVLVLLHGWYSASSYLGYYTISGYTMYRLRCEDMYHRCISCITNHSQVDFSRLILQVQLLPATAGIPGDISWYLLAMSLPLNMWWTNGISLFNKWYHHTVNLLNISIIINNTV